MLDGAFQEVAFLNNGSQFPDRKAGSPNWSHRRDGWFVAEIGVVLDPLIQSVRGQIRAIRPGDRPELIDKDLLKERPILERFKYRAKESIAQRNNAGCSILEFDRQ